MHSLIKSYLPDTLKSIIYPIEHLPMSHFNTKNKKYVLSARNKAQDILTEKELIGLHLLIGDEGVGKTTFVTNLSIQTVLKGNGLFFTDLFGKKDTISKIKKAVKHAHREADLIELDISVNRSLDNCKQDFLDKVEALERIDWKDVLNNKKIVLITGNLKDTAYSPNFIYYLREIFEDLVKDIRDVFTNVHLENKNLFLIHLDEAEIYVDNKNYLSELAQIAEHNKICVMCSFKVFNKYYTHVYGIEINNIEMPHLYKMGHKYLFKMTDYYSLEFLQTKLDKLTFSRVSRLHLGEYIIPHHKNRKEETFLID